ncbi:hypothetical protein AGMMS50256_06040 [Betaproteobacteria bacterium]|nr:hypothetical protein AGMMS50256_06040 [Betaproteobacteria bacterium]
MIEEDIRSLMTNPAGEKISSNEMEITRPGKEKNIFQQGKITDLKAIGASGNLEKNIAAEKFLVDFELKEYANVSAAKTSLSNALDDLKIIGTNASQIKEPDRYKEVDLNMAKPKMRDGNDLPLDGARIASRSQITRLENDAKSRGSDNEKAINQARQKNMRVAEKLYIGRQEKALGREPGKPQINPKEQFPKSPG